MVLCRTKRDAKKAMATLKAICDRLDLKMHPEKTKLANLWEGREGFDFLGFHHRKVRSRQGTWRLASWPSKKAMKKMREKVKEITAARVRLTMPWKRWSPI